MVRRAYLIVRRWVDWGIGGTSSELQLVMLGPIIIPIALVAPLTGGQTPLERVQNLGPMLIWALVWLVFSGWRAKRMTKALSIKEARRYERIVRYELPPEYAESESSVLAKFRQKSARRLRP
jgi:hypothetical protein